MLFFSGFSRTASAIAAHQIKNTPHKIKELTQMHGLTLHALEVLKTGNILDFGKLLHESWQLKRSLSDKISTSQIDEFYDAARSAGAQGGKLLGAGGGGFVLIFAAPEDQSKIRARLKNFLEIPFKFETLGSQIIFYQPNTGLVV